MSGSVVFWSVCSRCFAMRVRVFFCVCGAGILRGRAENKSGDTMTFKLHDISLFEQDT